MQQRVAALNKQLEVKVDELQKVAGERDVRAKEKVEACEQVEVLLLQLNEVQVDLDRYYKEVPAMQDLLHQYQLQSLATRKVLSKVVPHHESANH